MSSVITTDSDIFDRLRRLRDEEGLSQAEMGDRIGKSQQTWAAYESGKTTPPLSTLQDLVVEFDLRSDWFFMGKGQVRESDVMEDPRQPYIYENIPEDFEPESVAYVPVYGAPLGAGQAGNASMVEVRGYMAWERAWLRQQARIDPTKAFCAQVYGQSMETLISNGDMVLGEMQQVIDHDGIYAVRLEDELFIKHVMRRGDSIHLVSENNTYSTIEVGAYDDLTPIGRIVGKVGLV